MLLRESIRDVSNEEGIHLSFSSMVIDRSSLQTREYLFLLQHHTLPLKLDKVIELIWNNPYDLCFQASPDTL